MGEDLPRDVFYQWPRYFFDDPTLPGLAEQFARVRIPILVVNATDDKWAPPASRDAFMAGCSQAQVEAITIAPENYFRRQAQALWQQTLDWLRR